MNTHRRTTRSLLTGLAALPLALSQAHAAQNTAIWTGPAGGNYATASFWDIGQIPLNNATTTYSVMIGQNKTILYNSTGARAIDEFTFESGSTFTLSASSLLLPTDLTVLGRALILGSIVANNASFTALGAGTSLVGDRVTLAASGGGVIRIAGSSYSARGLAGATLFGASGAGSLVELSSLQTLDSGTGFVNRNYANVVSATDNAVVNLSGVKTLVAPAVESGTLLFSANRGGRVNLANLQEAVGLTLDTGYTKFSADGGHFVVGPLQKVNRMTVELANASSMTAGGYAGMASITDSTFAVSGGSTLNAASLVGNYGARGIAGDSLMSATGAGSLLDLSGLQTIDSGTGFVNRNYANVVSATDNAVVNLSGVKTLVAPAVESGTLLFTANRGGRVNLANLQEAVGLTLDTGYTRFSADGGHFVVGPLQKVNRMTVELANASSMTAGGYAGMASITNSTFAVSGGSTLNAASLVGNYGARGFTGAVLMSADGAGSTLDLSGLQTLDSAAGFVNRTYSNSVNASDKASINLSGVRTLIAPTVASGTLAFNASTGGSINLSSLQTVNTDNGGKLAFNAATGGSLVVGGINAGPGVSIAAVNTGSKVGVVGTLNLLSGSTLAAGTGTRLDIGGSFSFQHTVESQVNLDAATLGFSGAGPHTLEVGGARLAALTAGTAVLGNFGIGQLQVGAGATTFVQLVDDINNGNRGATAGGREVLYLNGDADGDGLSILNGSTLSIGNLDLYVSKGGQWTHINDLFATGVTTVSYDRGFITSVPEPAPLALMLAGLGLLRLRRQR